MRRPSHQSSVSPARSCTRRPSELFRVRSVLRCAVFGGHLLDEIDKLTLLQTGSALFPPRGQDSPQLQHSHFRQSIPAPVENRMLCVRRTRMPFKPLSLQIFQTLCCSVRTLRREHGLPYLSSQIWPSLRWSLWQILWTGTCALRGRLTSPVTLAAASLEAPR